MIFILFNYQACRDSHFEFQISQIVATAKTEKQSGKTPPPEAVLRDILEM